MVTKSTLGQLLEQLALSEAETRSAEARAVAARAEEEKQTRSLLSDLDTATASLAAVRGRVERLSVLHEEAEKELRECRAQLAAASETRGKLEELEAELGRQRDLFNAVKEKLAEVTRSLESP